MKISRRRFTKAGAVAPLVMTLGSRPVWGQTCSFSGQLSGNDYSTEAPQGANPPSYWLENGDEEFGSSKTSASTTTTASSGGTVGAASTGSTEGLDGGGSVACPQGLSLDSCVANYSQGLCVAFDQSETFRKALSIDLISSLKPHVAAAILDIETGQYPYGYDGLRGFLCAVAEGHDDPQAAIRILGCINGSLAN